MTGGADLGWRPGLPTPPPAEEVAGYQDLVEIGRGGDSVVYRGSQVGLGREVAVKVLLVDDPERVARFEREVQITVDLGRQHPNIVNLLAVGVTGSGRPCLVMDYYPAGTLHDRLKEHGPLPVDEVITIGAVLADALAFAHARGVLHRDVKPQNVLVLPTSWVLADFGIARLTDTEHTSSVETFTYRHAAPQVLDGMAPTAADDVWSLGSTLFTLVDGRPPFASDDPADDTALAYLRRARTEPHRRLTTPGSERIAPIIDRCLAKRVEDRWASAAELRDALAAVRSTAWQPSYDEPAGALDTGARPAPAPVGLVPPQEPAPADPVPAEPLAADPVAADPVPVPAESREERFWAPDATRRRPAAPAAPTGEPAAPLAVPPADTPPPEGLALSVLAHAPATEDALPTGSMPVATPPSPPQQAGAALESGPARGRRRSLLVLGAVALVVGLVLGIGGALLRREPAAPAAQEESSGPEPVGSLTVAPTQTGDAQVSKPDPGLRFVIRTLRFSGAGIDLAWTDPTDGEGYFVLHQTVPGPERPLARFDPGTTSTTWLQVARPGTRYCFAMTVHLPTGEIGTADVRCLKV